MKATGIVRRIDDLGRIVIPKEIRRVLRIRESDPLEIFTDHEGSIILRKYSPIGDMGSFAKPFAESLAQGDIIGAVVLLANDENNPMSEVEVKLAQSAAGFLGKQIEQ